MKIRLPHHSIAMLASVFCLTASPLLGQGNPLGGMGGGLRFDGAIAKLFGDHQAFSCNLEVEATPNDRPETMSLPTRLHFANGQARCEVDLSKIKGGLMPPGMGEQLKSFGLADLILLSQPNKPTVLIYPGVQSYAPVDANKQSPGPDRFTMAAKEIGRETIEGDECVQNQVTITGPDGKKFEAKVWNSARLKKFPVRVQSSDGGTPFTLSFRQIKFEKPAANLFVTPASYTKYEDAGALMRTALMKKLGESNGAAGTAPARPTK
jgi:hypothetical protein